ncbi:flagellar hook-associated protein FlgL [Methylophilus sp. QUAN]|uniref:flagellar hook-associated protein FlgL n=1 Tax=Methylophilus sp. QUAN TaxID=2781020 RepID=UPI00188F1730|nr:flagellar hook-associated protein FlgL [Methylophilus sp. QUAN]MBF4991630.1 flagellar hook-associated protein FlgL [Methylophilus sp. QUAN]
MRISTNTIYQSGTNQLMNLQADLNKLSIQTATGKRVNSPADDPVAAARILELNTAKDQNANYTSTRKTAETLLQTYEANLSSVTDTIQSIQSTLIAAGNGAYTDAERAKLANELQGSLDTLKGLANTKDSQGNYMYSGYASSTVPFDGNFDFVANSTRTSLQIDVQSQLPVTFTGDQVFGANGDNVFTNLQDIIALLKTPITDSTTQDAFNTGLATSIDKMKGSLNSVLDARSEIGSSLNLLDTLNITGDSLDLQYDASISTLQDLDYAQALSDISKKTTILQAAQKAFVATSNISLFSLI